MRLVTHKFAIILCLYCLFNFANLVYGESEDILSSNSKKHSCIQSVDGFAYLSENMTISQTRATAFANARRQALEMANTFIKSRTAIQDYQITGDNIDMSAEGNVKIIEQKDIGIENNNRYHVWIKAEVEYTILSSGEEIFAKKDTINAYPLTVKVWTSKDKYKNGDKIKIFIKGNKEFYAKIVSISPSKSIVQLFPNKFRNDQVFEAGKIYQIPDQKDKFNLTAGPPYGTDKIMVFASGVPLGLSPLVEYGNGLHLFEGTPESYSLKTRGIVISSTENNAKGSVADFYEASCKITTEK